MLYTYPLEMIGDLLKKVCVGDVLHITVKDDGELKQINLLVKEVYSEGMSGKGFRFFLIGSDANGFHIDEDRVFFWFFHNNMGGFTDEGGGFHRVPSLLRSPQVRFISVNWEDQHHHRCRCSKGDDCCRRQLGGVNVAPPVVKPSPSGRRVEHKEPMDDEYTAPWHHI
jgi:hypothetical protein